MEQGWIYVICLLIGGGISTFLNIFQFVSWFKYHDMMTKLEICYLDIINKNKRILFLEEWLKEIRNGAHCHTTAWICERVNDAIKNVD